MDREEIAKLVDQLDHPDTVRQREVMDRLVSLGPDAVEPLSANLTLAESGVRAALVQVLGEIGDSDALLPLMRFVWDTRGEVGESDARGLAMKAISSIAGPDDAQKVFQFLLDINDDDDTFVRGYAAAALGRFGDRRAEPILEEMANDEEEFVRERAQKALVRLGDASGDSLEQDLDDEELLQKLRGARGGERQFFFNELKSRENAFELATQLVTEGGKEVMTGLNVLQAIGDPRARKVAVHAYDTARNTAQRAVCLRILARHLDGDATDEERELIRLAFYDSDPFVELAALEAAGVTGDEDLIRRTLQAATDRDASVAAAATRSLSRGLIPEHRRLLPEVRSAFDVIHRRRLRDPSDELVRAEAYLVRSAKRLVEGGGFGTSRAEEMALRALDQADHLRPIVVTALELLRATAPKDGYPEARRWPESLVENALPLLRHPDAEIRDHALDALARGAPPEMERMVDTLEKLLYDRETDVAVKVIELLGRTQSVRARKILNDLTEEPDEEIRLAAEAALRRIRNAESFIDAEFE